MAKTNWQMDDTVKPEDLNQIGQEINELRADGSANDNRIGERTITDTTAPTSNTGKLTSLLNGFAYMIKAITGGANWRTLPSISLAAIKIILDAATNAATANALIKRDANGRAKVAAPSATDDIARKAEVDAAKSAAISAAATDATSKTNTVQTSLTTHINDNVKHVTAAERTAWNAKADKDGTLQVNLSAEMWRGWKMYAGLSQLGLTDASSVEEVHNALPTLSRFCGTINTAGALAPVTYCQVEIFKAHPNYSVWRAARNIADSNGYRDFEGVYHTSGGWSGWQEKAHLGSPAFFGVPTTPTASASADGKQIANVEYVNSVSKSVSTLSNVDTRETNELPSWYSGNADRQRRIHYEFKRASTVGITGYGTNYLSLITEVPWNGISGGTVRQIALCNDGKIFVRVSSSDHTAWQAWREQAYLDSPAFTGAPTTPTASTGSKTEQIASTRFVDNNFVAKTKSISPDTDLNTVTESGFYRFTNNIVNGPAGTNVQYSQMIVSRGQDTIFQMIVHYSSGRTFIRSGVVKTTGTDTWQPWREAAFLDSPAFTGKPTAGNPSADSDDNQLTTTAWTRARMNDALNSAKEYAVNMVALGSTTDPNTTQEAYILTNHVNSPDSSHYWHIHTYFFANKTENRAQLALSYNRALPRLMVRSIQANTNDGKWTAWREFAALDSPNFVGSVRVPTAAAGTNDTTAANTSFVNKAVADFVNATYIGTGEDLNNYRTEGSYYCGTNTVVANIANTPENLAFHLRVDKHAGVIQTFTTYEAGSPRVYKRNYYNSWGAWKRVAYTDQLPTAATQAQAEGGTDNAVMMTPLRVKQAIAALVPTPPVTSVAGRTGTIILAGTDVPAATTSARGTVQLSTATNSTSTTIAATASAVKLAYDRAEAAFQSASDGKKAIVDAITGKGGTASTSNTFAQLAAAITSSLATLIGYKWTSITPPKGHNTTGNNRFVRLTSSGEEFFLLTEGGATLYKSYDGQNWTSHATGISNSGDRYVNGLWYAGGTLYSAPLSDTSTNYLKYSTNGGATWNNISFSGTYYFPFTIVAGNGYTVFTSSQTSTTVGVYYSSNGTSFSRYTLAGTNEPWADVAYGNGMFLLFMDDGRIFRSTLPTTASSWTLINTVTARGGTIKFMGGYFVIVNGSSSLYSADGITWKSISISLNDLVYAGGVFVARSGNTTIRVSTDLGAAASGWLTSSITSSASGEMSYANGTIVTTSTTLGSMSISKW